MLVTFTKYSASPDPTLKKFGSFIIIGLLQINPKLYTQKLKKKKKK